MPTTPVRGAISPEAACESLVAAGSVLTLPALPLDRLLVGRLRWVSENLILAFPAFGERPEDVRAIRFKEVQFHRTGVSFMEGTDIRALLTSIANSGVEDPEDYQVAWSIWAEVWPLQEAKIEAALTAAQHASLLFQVGNSGPPFPLIDGAPPARQRLASGGEA